MNELINAFLFFLPAGMANIAPTLANRIPIINQWNLPLDFGKSYRGVRIFGQNKTWRGLIAGVVLAGLTASIESGLAYHALAQDHLWFTLAGMLMGFGALAGDAIESFFKRQRGIKAGESWFPYDQIDYIIGGLLAVAPFIQWYSTLVFNVFIIYFGLHLAINYLAYLAGLKDKPI